jgi:methylated-DNA-[protein]-cysteine S-methyltransferase
MTTYAQALDSPVGPLVVTVDNQHCVTRLLFARDQDPKSLLADAQETVEWNSDRCRRAQDQISDYFEGSRRSFDLELNPTGTPFQKTIWEVLRTIPFGQTRSYGEIAQEIGKSGASRAVGRANGTNPISIIVPCHRVIGADGSLTGFGGGLEAKRFLLEHEGVSLSAPSARLLPGFEPVTA